MLSYQLFSGGWVFNVSDQMLSHPGACFITISWVKIKPIQTIPRPQKKLTESLLSIQLSEVSKFSKIKMEDVEQTF